MRTAAMRGILKPIKTFWGRARESQLLQELEKELAFPIYMKRVDVMISLLGARPSEKIVKDINSRLELINRVILPYMDKETTGKSKEIDVDYWKKTLSEFRDKAKADKAAT